MTFNLEQIISILEKWKLHDGTVLESYPINILYNSFPKIISIRIQLDETENNCIFMLQDAIGMIPLFRTTETIDLSCITDYDELVIKAMRSLAIESKGVIKL